MSKITSTRFVKVVLENNIQCRNISAQEINAFELKASYKEHECDFSLQQFAILKEEYPNLIEISSFEIKINKPDILCHSLKMRLKNVGNPSLDKSILKIWQEIIQEY